MLILSEDGGPLTDNLALCSDQRFLASVQRFLDRDAETSMMRRAGYRLEGMGSREENWQSIQGFNATEEVIPT